MAICLISTAPCPLLIGIYKLLLPYIRIPAEVDNPIPYIIVYTIFNSNYVLIQCIEEICLFIMSKDFRKLVKNQFVRSTQTNAVATIHVSHNSQQQRTRQLNIQRNNLVNN
uniref:G_PROTEIN_RECEP_F1_2 domain-containing protein n=1 Tax=Meloidogyne hapla TaxID=6305 RepID=A0A1I8B0D0_MELHA